MLSVICFFLSGYDHRGRRHTPGPGRCLVNFILRRGARVGLLGKQGNARGIGCPDSCKLLSTPHCRIFPQTAVALTKVKQHGTEFSRAFRLCGHDLKVLERSKSTEICAEFVAGFMAILEDIPALCILKREREMALRTGSDMIIPPKHGS